ncbi:MAG: hypothetical protein GY703_13845 [Gammaproteobacteria bacterium]|nr:hypothetical protein [Gammaproteobacteria bacterium]
MTVSKKVSGKTLVEHHRKLEMRLLFVPLLTSEKTSQERWDGDVLVDLRALSLENGDVVQPVGSSEWNFQFIWQFLFPK